MTGARDTPASKANRKAATTTARGSILARRRLWRYGLILIVTIVTALVIAALWFRASLYSGMPGLPETADLWTTGRTPAIEFVGADGTTLAVRGPRYGRAVRMADLPEHVSQAFLSAEDKRFYDHDGADAAAIARAAWTNWRAGETVSGASTITQQLIKNLVLTPEQTLRRKAQEVRLAQALEERLTKDEILELYLNRVYFGAGAYGIDAAARTYFGVPATELSLPQAALLSTLPKAPSRLALTNDLDGALTRRRYVLNEMLDAGFISVDEGEIANADEPELATAEPEDPRLGYVFDFAAERLNALMGDAPPDLVVTLTINPETQARVHDAAVSYFEQQSDTLSASQMAGLVIGRDGAVEAMIGGIDYNESKFNRATQAQRQPGSAFKAFVYAAALETGIKPLDIRYDAPVQLGEWKPQNYNRGLYLGPVTVSESFARSLNTVAAVLGDEIGIERIIATARRFGISSQLRPLPSLALGSQETTLWDIVRAFGVFQNDGLRVNAHLIQKVETSRGDVIYERPALDPARVYPQALAREMNGLLARVVRDGTGSSAAFGDWTVAGKTGTSQDWRDAWFIGYTASRVGGVWVGNDDDSPMNEVTGGSLPSEVWSVMMAAAHEGEAPEHLAGAESVRVPSEEAERRLVYYRGLAGAFRAVSGVQSNAVVRPASQ
ncbi:MAG: PBP1A family penicillin-binding protein [Pseudomonadota bacterium]